MHKSSIGNYSCLLNPHNAQTIAVLAKQQLVVISCWAIFAAKLTIKKLVSMEMGNWNTSQKNARK